MDFTHKHMDFPRAQKQPMKVLCSCQWKCYVAAKKLNDTRKLNYFPEQIKFCQAAWRRSVKKSKTR